MKYLIIFTLFLAVFYQQLIEGKLSSKSYPAKYENSLLDVITQTPDKKCKEIVLLEINVRRLGGKQTSKFYA